MRGPSLAIGAIGIVAIPLLAHCGSDPTELEVEILATDCGSVRSTDVRAGAPGAIAASAPPAATKAGCSGGRIGSIVLFPSGANDARVELDVVTGITKDARECSSALDGCIQVRRIARFTPETSTRISLVMDPRCTGKVCPAGQTCSAGACVSAEDPSVPAPDVGDGGNDAARDVVDGGNDPCALCVAAGGGCVSGTCVIRCTGASKCGNVACPPGLPCEIDCDGADACGDVSCAGPGCTIVCTNGAPAACGAVTCAGTGDCNVTCGDDCSGKVTCTAAKCTVGCSTCGTIELAPTGPGSTADCGGECNVLCLGETCPTCQEGRHSCEPTRSPKCAVNSCDS